MKKYLIPQLLLVIPVLFLFLRDDPNSLNNGLRTSVVQFNIHPTHQTQNNGQAASSTDTPEASAKSDNQPKDEEKTSAPEPIKQILPMQPPPSSTEPSKTEVETSESEPQPQTNPVESSPSGTQSASAEEKTPGSQPEQQPNPTESSVPFTESTSTNEKAPEPEATSVEPSPPSNVESSSTMKETETETRSIYKSSGHHEDRCAQVNQKTVQLCKFGLQSHCRRQHISEELSSWWMVCPMYTANNEQTKHLYELHKNFRDYTHSYGINFQTIEVIFPGQEFQLTKPNNQPDDLQYKADWIFAMRENLVNVGVKHLPDDWQYMAWIDQHIFWLDPYWFEKCIWLFSHSNIVHMLNGNDFWNLKNGTDYHLDGFGMLYNKYGMGFQQHDPRQCGLAWGMRREIFEELGGLFDLCIGTKCDLYQNYAYAGSRYTSQTSNSEYASKIGEWQDHAIKVYDRKLGYLDSKVVHFMHCYDGCKTSEYNEHVSALMTYNYSPNHDLVRDEEGRLILKNNDPLAKELWRLYGGPSRNRLLRMRANRKT